MKRLLFIYFLLPLALQGQDKIMGFSSENAKSQLDWEKQFDAALNPKDQDTWMKFLSSHPHHVGTN